MRTDIQQLFSYSHATSLVRAINSNKFTANKQLQWENGLGMWLSHGKIAFKPCPGRVKWEIYIFTHDGLHRTEYSEKHNSRKDHCLSLPCGSKQPPRCKEYCWLQTCLTCKPIYTPGTNTHTDHYIPGATSICLLWSMLNIRKLSLAYSNTS